MAGAVEARCNVGLDFDGVIADDLGLKVEIVRQLFGIAVLPEILGRGAPPVLNAEQRAQLNEAVHREGEWALRLEPLPDAIPTINQLIDEGCAVRVITSRDEISTQLAAYWLHTHGLDIPIVGTNKQPKTEATHGLDVFVDDNAGKLHPLRHVPLLLLMHHPYNADARLPQHARRVENWADVHAKIGALLLANA